MSIKKALAWATKELKKAKIKTASLDALVLLCFILKKPKEWIYLNDNKKLAAENFKAYKKLIERRKRFEPVAYITNHKEFYGLDFYVDKNVLIPRPETEILVEQVMQEISNSKIQITNKFQNLNDPIKIADLGTGSGCIAISLAKHLKTCEVFAIDISENALKIAQKNAQKNKVKIKFLKGNFLEPLKQKVDIIVSNPPYVLKSEKIGTEVRYEPKIALYIKDKKFPEKLLSEVSKKLKDKGVAFLEIGKNQKQLFKKAAEKIIPKVKIEFLKDYSRINRIAKIKKGSF